MNNSGYEQFPRIRSLAEICASSFPVDKRHQPWCEPWFEESQDPQFIMSGSVFDLSRVVMRGRAVKAFSLVELLAAILIICLLASLGLFALSNSAKTAKRINCLNNLRTIGSAILHYANENNNNLPGPNGSQVQLTKGIAALTKSYFSSDSEFSRCWVCPANSNLIQANKSNSPLIGAYVANAQIFGSYGINGKVPSTTLAVLDKPSQARWLLCDLDSWSFAPSLPHGGNYLPVHELGRNILYLDAHVEYKKAMPEQVP